MRLRQAEQLEVSCTCASTVGKNLANQFWKSMRDYGSKLHEAGQIIRLCNLELLSNSFHGKVVISLIQSK